MAPISDPARNKPKDRAIFFNFQAPGRLARGEGVADEEAVGSTAARLSVDFGSSFSPLLNDTAARFVYYDPRRPPSLAAIRTPGFDTPWPSPTRALSPDSGHRHPNPRQTHPPPHSSPGDASC